MIKKCYPAGKSKAFTMSFDDGGSQDIRIIQILNRYGIHATFNLMGGYCNNDCFKVIKGDVPIWDGSNALRECFSGHEVASHSLTHPSLIKVSDEECERQIKDDIKILSETFGYAVRGFASPNGDYNDKIIALLKKYGIRYHRTASSEDAVTDYSLPDDFMIWNPAPHFAYYTQEKYKKIIDGFFTTDRELACLYIWGHGFEMTEMNCYSKDRWGDVTDRWGFFENEICRRLAGLKDVWYATNIQICEYVTAMRRAVISEERIENPTDFELFFEKDGEAFSVLPHSVKEII